MKISILKSRNIDLKELCKTFMILSIWGAFIIGMYCATSLIVFSSDAQEFGLYVRDGRDLPDDIQFEPLRDCGPVFMKVTYDNEMIFRCGGAMNINYFREPIILKIVDLTNKAGKETRKNELNKAIFLMFPEPLMVFMLTVLTGVFGPYTLHKIHIKLKEESTEKQ